MAPRPVRTLITVIMDVLVVVAIALTLRLVVAFFGVMAGQEWGETLLAVTRFIVLPAGVPAIETPYGGVFDANAAITVVVLLGVEWVLSIVRRSA